MDEWYRLLKLSELDPDSEAFKRAQEYIDEAIRIDMSSFRGYFYLGLANVLVTRDFEKARKRFEDALQRAEQNRTLNTRLDEMNMAHILNNLALLAVREKKLKKADQLWSRMTTLFPSSGDYREVSHNIAKVVQVIELSDKDPRRSLLQADHKVKKSFFDWKLDRAMATQESGEGRGWLYLPYVLPQNYRPVNDWPDENAELLVLEDVFLHRLSLYEELRDAACLACNGTGQAPADHA